MWQELSDRPEVEKLEHFLERFLSAYGEEVEFIVLFGSMARGDWGPGSDYDLLIGLRGEDNRRWVDRVYEFSLIAPGRVEIFPYSREEWQRMFASFHPLLLEALDQGVVLLDRGSFAAMREVFQEWRTQDILRPFRFGWQILIPNPEEI